jgi:hypothetical protein
VDDLGVSFLEWFGPELAEVVALRDRDVKEQPELVADGRWVWCLRFEERPGPPAGTV